MARCLAPILHFAVRLQLNVLTSPENELEMQTGRTCQLSQVGIPVRYEGHTETRLHCQILFLEAFPGWLSMEFNWRIGPHCCRPTEKRLFYVQGIRAPKRETSTPDDQAIYNNVVNSNRVVSMWPCGLLHVFKRRISWSRASGFGIFAIVFNGDGDHLPLSSNTLCRLVTNDG